MRILLLLAAATGLAGPAWAQAPSSPTCTVVAEAMLRVSDQPGVRQHTVIGEPTRLEMDALLLPDAMYVREDGASPWKRLPVTQAERQALARKALVDAPLSECSGPTAGRDGSVPVRVYQYRQPDFMKPGAFTTNALWIGDDGLPRRLVMSPTSYQTMEYGSFPAPTDLAPAREPRRKPAR